MPPWARLRGIANVFIQSQALYTAARLGVADVLAAGPLPTAELAAQVHAQPDRLARVMRLLAIEDIFEESSPGELYGGRSSATLTLRQRCCALNVLRACCLAQQHSLHPPTAY